MENLMKRDMQHKFQIRGGGFSKFVLIERPSKTIVLWHVEYFRNHW